MDRRARIGRRLLGSLMVMVIVTAPGYVGAAGIDTLAESLTVLCNPKPADLARLISRIQTDIEAVTDPGEAFGPTTINSTRFTGTAPDGTNGNVTITGNGKTLTINNLRAALANKDSLASQANPSDLCVALFGPGTKTEAQVKATTQTTQVITRTQVTNTIDILSSRIQNVSRFVGPGRPAAGRRAGVHDGLWGLSAGSAGQTIGLWLDGSRFYVENHVRNARSDGTSYSILGGADLTLDNTWLFGFMGGYTRSDIRIDALDGNAIIDGPIFGPYAAYIFGRYFSLDTSLTYSRLHNDTHEFDKFDANRFTGSANLNGFTRLGATSLTGFLGYVHSWEDPELDPDDDPDRSRTTRYGAFRFGGQVGYAIGAFEPFLPVSVAIETTEVRDQTNGKSVMLGLGLRYFFGESLQAAVQYTTEAVRSHTTNWGVSGNLRFAW